MSAGGLLIQNSKLQPTFGDLGTIATTGAGSVDVPYPTGIVAGSLLFCLVIAEVAGATITVPGGWTEIGSGISLSGGAVLGRCFWKVATGSESGNLTVSGTGSMNGAMIRIAGGLSIEGSSITGTAASANNIDAVNITTTGPRELAVQFVYYQNPNVTGNMSGESGTDYTLRETVSDASRSFAVQAGDVPAATSVTGGSATITVGNAVNRIRCGFAVVP